MSRGIVMSKIMGCSLVIKDDFENVLILQKKVKKQEPEEWSLVNSKLRGKESYEKSINRGIKDCIKALAFDLEQVGEYIVDEENDESVMVFKANIKEKPILDKAFIDYRWISKNQVVNYNLKEYEKAALLDCFK